MGLALREIDTIMTPPTQLFDLDASMKQYQASSMSDPFDVFIIKTIRIDAYGPRVEKLHGYLLKLREDKLVSKPVYEFALNAWNLVSKAISETKGLLPVPDASYGPEGEILYTWDKGSQHMEIEITTEQTAELFYYNRETGQQWYSEFKSGSQLPADAIDYFGAFAD
ncbi:MAG: hypothetical protein ACYC7E_18885 [Armatimonadota bacterium]